jgi:PTS system nitrogen regulatory IIA component
MLRLADLLTPARVTVALGGVDKASVLRELSGLFDVEKDGIRSEDVFRVFMEREALASTGVGSGVAIPHGRLAGLSEMQAAFGIHPQGVPFEAIDGQPVHILVAVLAPDRQASAHLKALARISRLLRDGAVRQRLIDAGSADAVLKLVVANDT